MISVECQTCNYCGKEYKSYNKKYCSRKCVELSQRKRVLKECLHCKNQFEVRLCNIDSKKYCSKACYTLAQINRKIPSEVIKKREKTRRDKYCKIAEKIKSKFCPQCKQIKNVNKFGKRKNDTIYHSWCNNCRNKYSNNWSKLNRKKNPKFKLSFNISAHMRNCLKSNKKGQRWESLVGFSINELKLHLESQFVDGMTWNNYGRNGWHIDHIIPISVFNFEKPSDIDFEKCWNLKNLQPLWEKDNIKKHDKLEKPFQPSLML